MPKKPHEGITRPELGSQEVDDKNRELAPGPSLEGNYDALGTAHESEAIERRDREALADTRREIESKEMVLVGSYRHDLYGSFAKEERFEGKIRLEKPAAAAAEQGAEKFRRKAKYMTNAFKGAKIAAEYDIRTNNFSTQTHILKLPDGRDVFVIYDHRGSWLHRYLDGWMKRRNGLKMQKVSRKKWKEQVEGKSTIPVIENDDPDTVMMPFLPNVNGHDLFAKNEEIEDFGACDWAETIDLAGKNALTEALVDEVKRIHNTGTAWGELILPNVIFTADKKPVVCDSEVRYDQDVPLEEAKAQDLRDLCLSVSAALEAADGQEHAATVKTILDQYGNAEVINTLKRIAGRKHGFFRGLFFGYEKVRTGTKSKKQYNAILKTITEYETPEAA